VSGAVGFLCLLMGQMQWERSERFYAVLCYVLAAIAYLDMVVGWFA